MNVSAVGIRRVTRPVVLPGPGSWSLVMTLLFLCFVTGTVLSGQLPAVVLLVYGLASAAAFLSYRVDKAAAHAGAWRVSEAALQLLSLVGGWPGAMLAQRKLRHKTRKGSFQRVFRITIAINVGCFFALLSPLGATLLT